MLGISLVLMLVDLLLSQQISNTGGLSGIGTRSVLATVQSALQLAQLAIIPFWQAGYIYLTLQLAKKEPVSFKTLTEGFTRFGPVIRLLLLQAALFIVIGIACTNISSTLFVFTPWAEPMLAVTEQMEQGVEYTYEQLYAALGSSLIPMLIMTGVLYLAVSIPFFYCYRLAMYSLMDEEQPKAFPAMRNSRMLTKGQRLQLFKLDLSFWWYYLLEVLVAALCYLDIILPLVGITLPVSPTVLTFLAFALYASAQLLLHYWTKNEVYTTYAQVYHTLAAEVKEKPAVALMEPQENTYE